MREIDLKDWVLFSEKRNSMNYKSLDGKYILKLSGVESLMTLEEINKEIEFSKQVSKTGVKTPMNLEAVHVNNEYGMISEIVPNKVSFSRALSENPDKLEYYATRFANALKEFHSHKCDKEVFESFDDRLVKNLEVLTFLSDRQKSAFLKLASMTEKCDTVLHGDCQPSNFLMSGEENYAIDLGFFGYGNPLYDLGAFRFFTYFLPDFVVNKLFHVNKELMAKFWNVFIKEYTGIKDEKKLKEFENKLNAYSLVAVTIHASHMAVAPVEFIDAINNNFEDVFKWVLEA